ncbi:MAG: TonB-dependent receptor, partial [Archangium sp.]|nr:TonB-dependent receptor [Archangium sp.]
VTSEPSGAEVFLDREDLGARGKTPLTLAVSPGNHTLLARASGYRTASARITTARGREVKQRLTLERVVGRVAFTGTPEGAVIRESPDGPVLGRLPATVAVAPGQRLFVVQADGHLPQQVLLDVLPEGTSKARVTLAEKPNRSGKLIVTANRDKAIVRVDGRDEGFTPTVVALAPGRHTLEVTTDEVTPFVQDIDIADDAELRIAAELRFSPPPVQAASKTAVSVDQAPASVTVISREEILSFGYQTLPEALRAIHGFYFTDDRIYTYIGLRGFSPAGDLNTRILILYDGHPINDVWAGQGYSARDFDVDLNEVDRIEVVRGPASILFGTGAFFGVINVVPRARVHSGRNVEGVVGAGGVGGVKARATGSFGSEGRSILLSGAAFTASGAELTDLGSLGTVRGLDEERAFGGSVRGQLGGFTLVGKLNHRVKQIPTVPLGADVGVAGTQYTDLRGFAELRYEHAWSRVTLLGRVAYDASRYEGIYARNSLLGAAFSIDGGGGDWLNAELRAFVTLWEGHRLMFSLETSGQFITQRLVDVAQSSLNQRVLLSGTALDEWHLTSWLFIQGGLRFDKYFDLTDIALSPRLAVVLRPYSSGVTKLVAGQAFRAPNLYELFFNDGLQTQRAAAGTLRPEVITTFELEHAHHFSPELSVSAGGYYNLIDRLVTLQQESLPVPDCGGADPVQCYVYRNTTAQLTAVGGQVELRWQPGRFTLIDAQYSVVFLSAPGL